MPEAFGNEAAKLVTLLESIFPETRFQAMAEALLILSDERFLVSSGTYYPENIRLAVAEARARLEAAQVDWRSIAIEARYARISAIQEAVTTETRVEQENFSDKLDRVLTHRIWGVVIFVGIMMLLFQSIFTFAQLPMDLLTAAVDGFGNWVSASMPPGDLNDAAREWRDQRRRCGRRFPAANSAAVFLHRDSGRHRLHGARGVPDGPADEQGRAARQKFHPDAQFVCVRHSRHHGHAHHRIAEGPARDHSRRAADELLGAAAGLHRAHRGVHSRQTRVGISFSLPG